VTQGVTSDVGRLRSVLVHRPGHELFTLTPNQVDALVFGRLPWAARAQEEHDTLTGLLRTHGVEVLYLADLLTEVLAVDAARQELTDTVLADLRLGDTLRDRLAGYLSYLDPAALAGVLTAGLARADLRTGTGLVHALADPAGLVVESLPNLLFTRDSTVFLGDQAVVGSLPEPARHREPLLCTTVLRWHPRFLGTPLLYRPPYEPLCGGDLLLLSRGVVALGVGAGSTAAGAERLSRKLLGTGLAHTVLVVPLPGRHPGTRLDTLVSPVDVDTLLVSQPRGAELVAYQVTAEADGELSIRAPRPLVTVAGEALGTPVRTLPTGLDPRPAPGHHWEDGTNPLVIAPGLLVAYDRSTDTNATLGRAGIEVLTVPGAELGSPRGGPRALCCPLERDPLPDP
jgi:arginine deiminase